MTTRYLPPVVPYAGPAAHYGAKVNKPIRRIVIHCTTSACKPGYAQIIARYFRITERYASAHYVVDPSETLQVVFDSYEAFHAPPNGNTIGIELCDPAEGPITRWLDLDHRRTLRRAAHLTARLCLAYGIPANKIGPTDLRNGAAGICGHVDVSRAWKQTTHTDPGAFPWRRFIRLVHAEIRRLMGEPEVKPTRVRRAREAVGDVIEQLAAVPKSRKRVHVMAQDLRDWFERFPKQ